MWRSRRKKSLQMDDSDEIKKTTGHRLTNTCPLISQIGNRSGT